jgi:D-lactate dehydrogenase
MNIVAYDPFPNEKLSAEYDFKYVTLDELLAQSDIITLHVPYMPATHHMINKDNIVKFKKGNILINTARGGLVETDALVQGLLSGTLAGYGSDVLEEEGFLLDELKMMAEGHPKEEQLKTVLADHELMRMENVIITPHMGAQTSEALKRILDTTAENILAFAEGKIQNSIIK